MNRLIGNLSCILLSLSLQGWLSAEPPQTPIRIGILHSLSGTMAISESSLVDAMQMAIDEINVRGGVLNRPLEAIVEDGASDWPTFALKAEKLIVEEQVVSVFGCWTSASRKAVKPILEKHNALLWYPVQYEGRETSSNIIYTGATPNQQITPAVDWCHRELGGRMFLVGSDYVFPRTANEIIQLRLADLGEEPVGEAYRPLGSQDFSGIVAEIQRTQPDVVLNTINGDSNRAFFQALSDAGITSQQIPVMSFSVAEDELRAIGTELTTGHFASWNYFQSIDTAANRRFVREFRRRYGETRVTDDPIEAAYTQVHMFAKAVENAGQTDVDAIRQAARGLIIAAPGGLVRIDPHNQHTWKVARIGKILTDGQFRIVWSSDDPLPPHPFLAESFLTVASEDFDTMFRTISAMIELERNEPADQERKQLLIAMADVRGFLGQVRSDFRTAGLLIRPRNRDYFKESWAKFELRWSLLSDMRPRLTAQQQLTYDQFAVAHDSLEQVAQDMLSAIYASQMEESEVPQ